ncbi:hypothetical protein L2755_06995 [Shewanella abyssi]|uniref:hypothetical protein n=1 Tax=Shewanella abyssi TaxID=311789 RepID=UPI00201012CA|nr:hypothetical protein [Shewanella abyssi]MCL1049370.1 hypothetical protein [Shewanella abyssi]
MDISSVSGDIKASKLTDKVMLHTVSGDISSRELDGKVILETVSGDATVALVAASPIS